MPAAAISAPSSLAVFLASSNAAGSLFNSQNPPMIPTNGLSLLGIQNSFAWERRYEIRFRISKTKTTIHSETFADCPRNQGSGRFQWQAQSRQDSLGVVGAGTTGIELFGGRPRRFTAPWRASMARL